MFSTFLARAHAQTRGSADTPRPGYLPGLDGLRALAVMAVLVYHADVGWLPGGFLGVEIFFVISGYLITLLLLTEYRAKNAVSLKQFWLRRVRRLLPALLTVILAVLVYAVVYLPEEVANLRLDIVSAFTYSTNWYLILANKSYFETVGRPSLLRHLWSLAIEEQFYLVWPLLFTYVLVRLKPPHALLVLLLGATVSALWMYTLFQPNTDPSRIYYGTDTRAAGFFLGAALAFVRTPRPASVAKPSVGPWRLDAAAWAAFGTLVAACVLLHEFASCLYQGGMVLVAVATTLMIAAAVHPQSPLFGPVMSCRGLRWIGLRSYSLYLWHWPVFMVTRPQLDITMSGVALFALRMGLTFVLAELSYRFVETPIRHGALGKAWTAWHRLQGSRPWGVGLAGMGVMASIVMATVLLGSAVMNAQPPHEPDYVSMAVFKDSSALETRAQAQEVSTTFDAAPNPWLGSDEQKGWQYSADATEPVNVTEMSECSVTCQTPQPLSHMPENRLPSALPSTPAPQPDAVATAAAPLPAQPERILALGDSVMLGASSYLRTVMTDIEVDAAVGRQVSQALKILRAHKSANRLAPTVIIHLGNNSIFRAEELDEIMQLLQDVPRVMFLTNKIPRPWQRPNNITLSNGVKRYPNARLVDWYTHSAAHPEWFWNDGIHLRPEGAKTYARLMKTAMQ